MQATFHSRECYSEEICAASRGYCCILFSYRNFQRLLKYVIPRYSLDAIINYLGAEEIVLKVCACLAWWQPWFDPQHQTGSPGQSGVNINADSEIILSITGCTLNNNLEIYSEIHSKTIWLVKI